MSDLKNEINILKVCDIGGLIKNQDVNYLVKENEDNIIVEELPLFLNSHFCSFYNNLAYDYDLLNERLKDNFKLNYKKITKIDNNTYRYSTKRYIKKHRK